MTPSGLENHAAARMHTPSAPAPGVRNRRDPSDDPLLTVKLTVPVHPGGLVSRQRLLDHLTEGARGPLTVITGAAGAGKTALAASWTLSDAAPGPVAWVSLDADDRPGTFWAYVLGAFRQGGIALGGDIGTPPCADYADHSLLVRLAASFERLPGPVVLVVDGLDKVSGQAVPAGLRFLVEHAGPNLRLVVLGRDDPPLPLHRYRAEQRVSEIRGGDLAFTADEAVALLDGHGLTPGRDVVEALVRRTEGWAAGLRLCALVMAQYDDPSVFVSSFGASEQAVADYLLAEVLDTQPTATQELLLRTSILDQVHPDLADALTARQGAERILTQLARAHAFVEPVADTGWYRFHPLLAEVLRAHLRSQRPEAVPALHRRAARWLAGAGRTAEALEHAAAGGDWQFATAQAVHHLMVGRLLADAGSGSLADLFARMPDDVDGTAPALVAAACCLSRQDTVACRARLGRAEDRMRREATQPEPEEQLTCLLYT